MLPGYGFDVVWETGWGRPQSCHSGTAWAAPPQGLRASTPPILGCVALSCATRPPSGTPGPRPPPAVVTTKNVSRYCQTAPG